MSCSGNCINCTIGCVSGCHVTCLTSEQFCGGCAGESQNATHYFSFTQGNFAISGGFRPPIIKGFPAGTLTSWAQFVQNAANHGDKQDSGGWTWQGTNTPFLRAANIMALVAGINSLGGGSHTPFTATGGGTGTIIRGSDFEALRTVLNGLQLNVLACHRCNTACNGAPGTHHCNTCQNCVTCNNQSSWPGQY